MTRLVASPAVCCIPEACIYASGAHASVFGVCAAHRYHAWLGWWHPQLDSYKQSRETSVFCMCTCVLYTHRYHAWLGWWHPQLDSASTESEIMCYPRYNITRSEAIGNEPLVRLLLELAK